MKIEFNQGLPDGCIQWLKDNVGEGNLPDIDKASYRWSWEVRDTDAWFYERVKVPCEPYAYSDDPFKYVPSITIHDEKKSVLFALRWL
jgi:hypothetical protein